MTSVAWGVALVVAGLALAVLGLLAHDPDADAGTRYPAYVLSYGGILVAVTGPVLVYVAKLRRGDERDRARAAAILWGLGSALAFVALVFLFVATNSWQ